MRWKVFIKRSMTQVNVWKLILTTLIKLVQIFVLLLPLLLGFGKVCWRIEWWFRWVLALLSLVVWMLRFGIFFWLPLMPNFKPIPNANLSSLPSFSVANLILERECSWNSSLLVDLFHSITVQRILSIRLPQISSFDKWTWASFLEIFFVKSVHEVLAFFGDRPSPLSKEALPLENRPGYLAFSS